MATYYWVGGSGTWDGSSKTNWATSSGGAGGNGPPTSADTVQFNSSSGTGIVTTANGSACAVATLNSSTLELTLGADHTMSGAFTLTLGTLNLGSYKLTCSSFASSNTNARTINFGTGDITLTGSGATILTMASATNLTVSGSRTINATYSGSTGTRNLQGVDPTIGGTEANALDINITAGSDTVLLGSNSRLYRNINFTGFSGTFSNDSRQISGNLIISTGMTLTAGTAVTTFVATSGTQQITTNGKTLDFPLTFNGVGGSWQLVDNLTTGSTRTVTLTNGALDLNSKTLSCGLFSSNNSNTRSIAFGTGNITLTGSGATIYTISISTNLTTSGTPVVNATYSGSTGTRRLDVGTLSESNAITYNITAGSDIIDWRTTNGTMKNLNFTGFTGSITGSGGSKFIYGDLTFGTGMTASTTLVVFNLAATSGTKTITTNGVTVDCGITFSGIGGTWQFADALTQGSTKAFTITEGTIKLKAGATSTVGAFATSGSNQKYLQSTTAGSQATLSQASGTVTVSYLSIKDIAATGGATWNAYVDYNNVDQGDNTGWDFSYSPAIDNEFPVALRSFTQPKRF